MKLKKKADVLIGGKGTAIILPQTDSQLEIELRGFSDASLRSYGACVYSQFEKAFVTVLDNHVPLKKKQLRFNHSPFMTKALRKAIMTRSRFKNIYNKKRSYEN